MQFVPIARYWAQRRTWLTVVIGVGVDLLLMALVMGADAWFYAVMIVALSSVGIILRSLVNEHQEEQKESDAQPRSRRAPNKVIWNMEDARDHLDMAWMEWEKALTVARATRDARLERTLAYLGQELVQISQRVHDARWNRYRESVAHDRDD